MAHLAVTLRATLKVARRNQPIEKYRTILRCLFSLKDHRKRLMFLKALDEFPEYQHLYDSYRMTAESEWRKGKTRDHIQHNINHKHIRAQFRTSTWRISAIKLCKAYEEVPIDGLLLLSNMENECRKILYYRCFHEDLEYGVRGGY